LAHTYTQGRDDALHREVAAEEGMRYHGLEKPKGTGNVLENGKLEWESNSECGLLLYSKGQQGRL